MTYTGPAPTGPRTPPGGIPTNPPRSPWEGPPPPPAPPAGGNGGAPAPVGTAQRSAQAIIMGFLNQYGLGSLAAWAWKQYLALGGGPDAITQIQFELPDQPAFKARFPAYAKLAKEGHALSPGDMIALEQSYAQALHGAGLPAGFYDHPNDFAAFMLNDVSPSEVAQRAQLAASLVLGDPEARRQADEFGFGTGHQIAWALDPTRALPLIQQQVLAAQDAAAAKTTGFGQLTREQAVGLGQQGVSVDQARQGFSQLATQAGLFQGTLGEGSSIGADEQIGAAFRGNAHAQLRIQLRQQQRRADFAGSGGFAPQTGGVAGLGQQQ